MQQDFFKGDKPDGHTGYLLWQLTNIRQRKINSNLQEIELTYQQFIVVAGIKWLNQNEEVVNQVKLINFTKMDKSVVSNILKLLEKKDIVIRRTMPTDTRAKSLELSEIGLDKLERALEIVKRTDELFFSVDSININDLNSSLKKLMTANLL